MNVNGIILTPEACKTLLALQAEDNGLLKSNIKDLTNLSKKIAIEASFNNGNEKDALATIAFLFSMCDVFKSLFAQEGGME